MKTFTAAEVAATTPEQLAALRAGPPAVYAAWIQKAADMGLTEAQAIYGQMLLDGAGIGRDPVQALSWFKRAAHADHLMSINMVGRCYENGWGVPRDEVVAAYWFRLAADRGLDWGMYNYAHMLRQGRGGVPQDQAAALALYRKAAKLGHIKSIGMLGRYYEAGTPSNATWTRPWPATAAPPRARLRGMFHLGRLLLARGQADAAEPWLARVPETAPPAFLREVRRHAARRRVRAPLRDCRGAGVSLICARPRERANGPRMPRARRRRPARGKMPFSFRIGRPARRS
nr:tetratricopeptide repeat protein [Achromobacter sp. DMS1]